MRFPQPEPSQSARSSAAEVPAIEPRPNSPSALARQQTAIALLGQKALAETDLPALFDSVTRTVAEVMAVPYSRLWQVQSDGRSLVCTAQVVPAAACSCENSACEAHSREAHSREAHSRETHSCETQSRKHSTQGAGELRPEPVLLGADGFGRDLPAARVLGTEGDLLPVPAGATGGVMALVQGRTRALGVLELYATDGRSFGSDDLLFLQSLSNLLAPAIARARMEGLQVAQTRVLQQLARGEALPDIFNNLCLLLEAQLPGAYCSILLVDEARQRLRGGAAPTLPPDYAAGLDGLLVGQCSGSCGTAAYRGEPVFANDIATDPLWEPFRDFALSHDIRACWSAPFFSQCGKVLGTFAISHRFSCEATEFHREVLSTAANLASIATERHRANDALEQSRAALAVQVRERTAALEQLENALEELQSAEGQIVQREKMSSLGNLVAGIAHEINNPVGCIVGNLPPARNYVADLFGLIDRYQDCYPEPLPEIEDEIEAIELDFLREDLPKLLDSIGESANRIKNISASMRTFARSDTTHRQAFDLHEGLDSTLLILRHRLKAQDFRPAIALQKKYGDLPPANCFPGQINQVFTNILANAIDAIDEASQTREFGNIAAEPYCITVQTERSGDRVRIALADNGPGMPESVRERAFDRLFTTKPAGRGTGLGLPIARQIVEDRHGGRIQVESEEGKGTVFYIELPIAGPESDN